jgi:ElaA protein
VDTVKDIYIQKCRNFSSIDEESFQKIIDLRDKSKGDKIYDDQKIDKESHHLLIYLKEILVAYARLWPNSKEDISLQRFSVSKEYRNKGVAKNLMEFIFQVKNEKFIDSSLILTSREYTKEFYEKFGFVVYKKNIEEKKIRFYMRKTK